MAADSIENDTSTVPASILVAEDDVPTGQYFREALLGFGYRVALLPEGNDALDAARAQRFDLLVLDCRMPRVGAVHILSSLRDDPAAASHAAPALATSAEMDATKQHQLRQMGFADVIPKPVALADLKAVVEAQLAPAAIAAAADHAALLDDASALERSGAPDAVRALRGLFLQELKRLDKELEQLASQPTEFAERLHRLLASCGFCGAQALADASRDTKRKLDNGVVLEPADVTRFRDTVTATLHALADDQPS